MKSVRQYKILKLSTTDIIGDTKSQPFNIGEKDFITELQKGNIVSIADNQALRKIRQITQNENQYIISIINIQVPINNAGVKQYGLISKYGFVCNGIHYIRFMAGSGQIRGNTVSFIDESIIDKVNETLYCGLQPEDFGNDFILSKFNAYHGLSMSGVHFMNELPKICIVNDYEVVKPHEQVNYVETIQPPEGEKVPILKKISNPYYDEGNFPPLNSFDGQGLMSPAFARQISDQLDIDYLPSECVVRAPWIKGLLVTVDWHTYFREKGITQIRDIFGQIYNIEDVDVLISKSQFKMCKIYAKKGGWQYYCDSMAKCDLKFGVVLPNKKKDDDVKAINYQYINALQLKHEDLDELCSKTVEQLNKFCSDDIKEVFETVTVYDLDDDSECDVEAVVCNGHMSVWEKAVKHNRAFLEDKYIRQKIYDECKSQFKEAKIGKLLCNGNYQYMVSDPVAQMQAIIKQNGIDGEKCEVTGVIPAHYVYSQYWGNKDVDKIALFRSPMIARDEASVRGVYNDIETCRWFEYLQSGIVLSIHDLTALQAGGADYDGDRIFTSNEDVLIRSVYDKPLPLVYEHSDKAEKGSINAENLVASDVRGLNSKVGQYSNMSGSFYTKLAECEPDSENYNDIIEQIVVLGEIVGVEIDRIKTSLSPQLPTKWDLKSKDKPYYFRYIYADIDSKIKTIQSNRNAYCRQHTNMTYESLSELPEASISPKIQQRLKAYDDAYPVKDNDMPMNVICRKIEAIDTVNKNTGGRNMLQEFVTNHEIDTILLNKIKQLHKTYNTQKRILTAKNRINSYSNSKSVESELHEIYKNMTEYIYAEIMSLCSGDIQLAFDCCVTIAKSDEAFVWNILSINDTIFNLIKRRM